MIEVEKLQVDFTGPERERVPVLDVASFEAAAGEQVCLVGGSGSGKTTFLNVLAGITPATSGRVSVDGTDLSTLSESARDRFRAHNIGYVFQSFNLLQGLSAQENVALAGTFVGRGPGSSRKRARDLLKRLELGHRVAARPGTLSVGEQQRVGIARALMNEPKVVLADEPTANLDDAGAARALDLLMEVVRERGATLILVTHDARVRERFDAVLELTDINRVAKPEAAE